VRCYNTRSQTWYAAEPTCLHCMRATAVLMIACWPICVPRACAAVLRPLQPRPSWSPPPPLALALSSCPRRPPQNCAQCRAAIVAASSTPRCRFRRRRPAAAAVMSTRRRRSAAARRFRSVCCRTCHLVVAADSTRSGRLGCGGQSRRGRMDRRGSVSQGPPWPPPRRAHDRENMLRTCVPECPNVVSNSLAPAVPECMCAKAARRES
jgi:hypothetical protein